METTSIPHRMNWEQLLCFKRVSEFSSCKVEPKPSNYSEVRSPFEKDFDQLIYSYPFRRLQDKTQVIPFPEFDFVHTRLTHSLEVATVGRSLGKMAAEIIFRELGEKKMCALGLCPNDIGTLVAAACLAHDIGNPPFGHSGENSISLYFDNYYDLYRNSMLPDYGALTEEQAIELSKRQDLVFFRGSFHDIDHFKRWNDLIQFEGNANGFRIITRNCEKGINPTAALLGTFTKYPRESGLQGYIPSGSIPKHLSKYGFFQSEKEIFYQMAMEVGLLNHPGTKENNLAYCRHPLAYLMEASDDIAYSIIDFEDGCRLGLIDFYKKYGTLRVRNKKGKMDQFVIDAAPIDLFIEIAAMDESFNAEKVLEMDFKEALSYLRSKVINVLTHECFKIFGQHYEEIMQGKFSDALIDKIVDPRIKNGMEKMKFLVRKFVYNFPPVLQSEASGFEVMDSLIGAFAVNSNICISCGEEPDARAIKLQSLLPDDYSPKEEIEAHNLTPEEVYNRLILVLDYVSGMTDNYAMFLYRKIKGISHH